MKERQVKAMKKRFLPLLLALLLLLAGCELLPDAGEKPRAASNVSIWAMDTQMDLRLYGDEDGAVMERLTALLYELDGALSATSADSALTALNDSGVSDDPRLAELVEAARSVSAETGGALDITLLPVSLAWGFTADSYRVVPEAELETLRDRVGMDRISLEDGQIRLAAGTRLDFGALAKGYAGGLCRAEMEEAGLSGILSLGGNIQTVGTKPDGSDWIIGVQDPDDPGAYELSLRLSGAKAVVTSGDYQRYFLEDGVRYCHILDPKTLAPVRGSLRAVTVVADEGLRADALATALFVMGREAGEAFWRERKDFEAIWREADGTIWLTPGLAERVSEGSFREIDP